MSVVTKKSDTHEERYAHVKVDGVLCNRATVFARKDEKGWAVSVAYCSRKDIFSRDKGRGIARRRFFFGQKSRLYEPISYEAMLKHATTFAP